MGYVRISDKTTMNHEEMCECFKERRTTSVDFYNLASINHHPQADFQPQIAFIYVHVARQTFQFKPFFKKLEKMTFLSAEHKWYCQLS